MQIVKHQITGSTVSQIDDLSSLNAGQFLSSDLFLISQQALSNVSPDRTYSFNDKIYHNEYRSLKEKYDTLSNKFFDDADSLFGFKSMTLENEEHYSLNSHIHNYSKVSCVSLIKPNSKNDSNQLSSIVTFNINNKKTTIYMPKIYLYEDPKPYIGQLKFMALYDLPLKPNNIDFYKSKDFDGWVYPDGRELSVQSFKDAYSVFGESYGSSFQGKTFKIPNLNNFIKALPFENSLKQKNLADDVIYQNNLSIHTHSIKDMSISGNISIDLSIHLSMTHSSEYNAIHDSHGSDDFIDGYFEFGCNNLTCVDSQINNSDQSLDGETYPAHNLLPVLMYIGDFYE